jgi:hypothetical protein
MKKISFVFAVIVCAVFLIWSSESRAIGDTEQGILWGILGTVTLGKILDHDDDSQYYPNNPTGEFPPFRCSGDSVTCAYERGKWEREHEEWLKAKDRAYQCGRFPEKCSNP